MRTEIRSSYFEWLVDLACGERYSNKISYRKLLDVLHNTKFTYSIPNDRNRAEDGMDLRGRFASDMKEYPYDTIIRNLAGRCSILEMMIALSIRCEENIMDDPNVGDRTGQWFWGMIINLGLGHMTDDIFDYQYVVTVINRFLDREYEPDGRGGLFTVRHCDYDLRTAEIWYQLCWYLDSIT